ncbi:hypothetical protein JXI42_11225 [bacterium]|nr:hypothetical protein [bacterium]
MCKSKMTLYGLFIWMVFFVLVIFNQPSLADRLLPNHANYFEIEVIDSVSAGSTYTHTEKFFPFGWWYGSYDTVPAALDSMNPETNNYNVFMPTIGLLDNILLKNIDYGIEKGMYAFGTFPRHLNYGLYSFIDRFENLHPNYSYSDNKKELYDRGWVDFCPACTTIDSTDFEILNVGLHKDVVSDTQVIVNCLHIISEDTNFTLNYDCPDSANDPVGWFYPYIFELTDWKLNWLSFKIASDSTFRDSSYTFRFIAKYLTHKEGDTSDTATIYVELNSGDLSPEQQGYVDSTSTITVSLQNTDYFSDDTGAAAQFPLYGRNPDPVVDLMSSEDWFIVFAMMDSIIYNFTDTVGDPYILDSLIEFKLIGTHYYIDNIGYSPNTSTIKKEYQALLDTIMNDPDPQFTGK